MTFIAIRYDTNGARYDTIQYNIRYDTIPRHKQLTTEPLPGITGDKRTWPLTFWEHKKINIYVAQISWKQKKNKTGNTGTEAYFREQATLISKKYF